MSRLHVLPAPEAPAFNVERYLAEERAKDLLRFSTAGSVDDGKSTLIGRLLYDTQSVYEDQVRSIEGKGTTAPGVLDLALLTDGLRAEREQGITIDVAYRYFATARRKFIVADTPGHEQYTRNMATGASTADAAIVLVDARKGVLPQSRRHAAITALLGVPQVVVAVNKMDLVGWSGHTFEQVRTQFQKFFGELDRLHVDAAVPRLHFVPVSALGGDNIVHRSAAMRWYAGPTLLELLEALPSSAYQDAEGPFRFAVQRVARPHLDFRGFAGQIAAGTVRPGMELAVLPSGRRSRVARIVTFDGDLASASAPLSVTLTLEDEIDISRGDLLVAPDAPAAVATEFTASLVWMSTAPLELARRYLLKQGSRTVQAYVRALHEIVALAADDPGPRQARSAALELNGIGVVAMESLLPLAVDPYRANRHTGSFVLIDPDTNGTVAAGMVRSVGGSAGVQGGPVSPDERAARWGHTGALLAVSGSAAFADALERALFERGAAVLRVEPAASLPAESLGVLALTHLGDAGRPSLTVRASAQTLTEPLPGSLAEAVQAALHLLHRMGVLTRPAKEIRPWSMAYPRPASRAASRPRTCCFSTWCESFAPASRCCFSTPATTLRKPMRTATGLRPRGTSTSTICCLLRLWRSRRPSTDRSIKRRRTAAAACARLSRCLPRSPATRFG